MIPTIGRIVHYTLSERDAAQINALRGPMTHQANPASEGDVFPMMIVRVWGNTPESAVQGQVFIDGAFTLWATSATPGEGPRHFAWPTVIKEA